MKRAPAQQQQKEEDEGEEEGMEFVPLSRFRPPTERERREAAAAECAERRYRTRKRTGRGTPKAKTKPTVDYFPENNAFEDESDDDEEQGLLGVGGGNDGEEKDTLPLLSVAFGDDIDSHAVQRGFAELPSGGYEERQAMWLYQRIAVMAVTKAGAWQVACVAGAMGRWLSIGRGLASWLFLRFYLRRTYVGLPFAIWTFIDTSFFLYLSIGEPTTAANPNATPNSTTPIMPQRHVASNGSCGVACTVGDISCCAGCCCAPEDASPLHAPLPDSAIPGAPDGSMNPNAKEKSLRKRVIRRMDAFMRHSFLRRRRRRERRAAARRGVGRLGIHMPLQVLYYFTPSRRCGCVWGFLWALIEATLATLLAQLISALREIVSQEPDGGAVAEWTGFRALLLLGMWLCYLSIPIRLIESISLLACSLVPRVWFQGDTPHSASLKRKDRKARRWRLSARTPRVILVAAVLTWTASATGCGVLSYTLVAGMFTPYRMWHKPYWEEWMPFPSDRFLEPDYDYAVMDGAKVPVVNGELLDLGADENAASNGWGIHLGFSWWTSSSTTATATSAIATQAGVGVATRVKVSIGDDASPPLRTASNNGLNLKTGPLLEIQIGRDEVAVQQAIDAALADVSNAGLAGGGGGASTGAGAKGGSGDTSTGTASTTGGEAGPPFTVLPRLPERDGFSTVAPLVFSLPQIRWSSSSMVPHTNIGGSILRNTTTLIYGAPSHTASPRALPHWTECDEFAHGDTALIQPASPLAHGQWYFAGVRGLRDERTGHLLKPAPGVRRAQEVVAAALAAGLGDDGDGADDDSGDIMNFVEDGTEAPEEGDERGEKRRLAVRALWRLVQVLRKYPKGRDHNWVRGWVNATDLQAAWAFPTISADSSLSALNHMRNITMKWLDAQPRRMPPSKVVRVDREECSRGKGKARIVWGRLVAPSFLEDHYSRYSGLDDDGWGGWDDTVGWAMVLPCSVLQHPSKNSGLVSRVQNVHSIVQYGHGLFADRSEVAEDWVTSMAQDNQWVMVATDWRGMTRFDTPVVLQALLSEPHKIVNTVGNIKQSFVHQALLLSLAPSLVSEQLVKGSTIVDAKSSWWSAFSSASTATTSDSFADSFNATSDHGELAFLESVPRVFYGVSNGAILGAGYTSWVAPTKLLSRAALTSGGANFAGLLLTRSSEFSVYALVLDLCFFERRSVRLFLILMQMVWDPLEASSWANLETTDPGNRLTPTMTRVPTLVQAGAGDASIPKLAAHLLARALGSIETDDLQSPYNVWGLATPDRPAPIFDDDADIGIDENNSGNKNDDNGWWSVGFEGVYSDPVHKQCQRKIVKVSDTKASVSGVDGWMLGLPIAMACDVDHDVAWGPLDAVLELNGGSGGRDHGRTETISVDFSEKGGPAGNLVGLWDPSVPGIKWEDGNTWTWHGGLGSEADERRERRKRRRAGEIEGNEYGGDSQRMATRGPTGRSLFPTSTDSPVAVPTATPTTVIPVWTPTAPVDGSALAALRRIPGNYSDPAHPGCVRLIHDFMDLSVVGKLPSANTIITGTAPVNDADDSCDVATDKAWNFSLPLEYDAATETIVVDFRALGGPSDVVGFYDPTLPGIVWDEASGMAAWMDLIARADNAAEEAAEETDDDLWIAPLTEDSKGEAWRGSVFTQLVYAQEDRAAPSTNTPSDENGVHQCLRRDPAVVRQLAAFVAGVNRTAALKNYCEGRRCIRTHCGL